MKDRDLRPYLDGRYDGIDPAPFAWRWGLVCFFFGYYVYYGAIVGAFNAAVGHRSLGLRIELAFVIWFLGALECVLGWIRGGDSRHLAAIWFLFKALTLFWYGFHILIA